MSLANKDLLGLRHLHKEELNLILDQAASLKQLLERDNKTVPTLRGKTFVNLFFEPSTRTRMSFDMAIKRLGASALTMNVQTSSVKKGESLYDTVKNIEAMEVDGIIVRHSHGGAAQFIADTVKIPVINAGDGFNEHPTQGLLDIFTMIQHMDTVKGKHILIVGDIRHSRVARSNIWGLTKLGAKVYVCGPSTLIPPGIEEMGAEIIPDLDKAIPHMDCINVLRVQFERQDTNYFPSVREYRQFYSLTLERLNATKEDAVIMHPGPINRGIEMDSDVADGPKNVILEQVTNGVAIRMAALYLLSTRGGDNG